MVAVAVLLTIGVTPPIQGAGPSAELRGYRLRGYRWDAVLEQRWAVFEDAAHPERPLLSEPDPGGRPAPEPAAASAATEAAPVMRPTDPVVHSGDTVTLWKIEGNVRIQLAGTAEGNAAVGGHIQLRVTGAGVFGGTGWRVAGVVRGPGNVEME